METITKFSTYTTKSGTAYATLDSDTEGLLPHLPIAFSDSDDDAAWSKARLHIGTTGLSDEWEPVRVCCHVLQDWRAESLPDREAAIALDVADTPTDAPLRVMLVGPMLDAGCRQARANGKECFCIRGPAGEGMFCVRRSAVR